MALRNRVLNPLESAFFEMNRSQPFIIIQCVYLNREISVEILEKALDIMLKRSPPLSCAIRELDRSLEFVAVENARIPVKTIENASNERWIEECSREINLPLETVTAPLAAVILAMKRRGVDVIFKFSHIISDGISVFHFISETFQIIDQLSQGNVKSVPDSEPDIHPDPADFPIRPVASDISISEINRDNKTMDLFKDVPDFPLKDRSTRIISTVLSSDQSEYLLKAGKEKNNTVNSLLGSALAITLKRDIQEKYHPALPYRIKSSSGLNLRKYYKSGPKDSRLGCWAGFGYVFMQSDELDSLWKCGETYKERLSQFIRIGKPFAHLEKLIENYSRMDTEAASGSNESRIPYAILSNLGICSIDEHAVRQFGIEGISFMTPMHRNWINDMGFGLCAATFDSRLNLVFHYMHPARTEEQAKVFIRNFMDLLFQDRPELIRGISLS